MKKHAIALVALGAAIAGLVSLGAGAALADTTSITGSVTVVPPVAISVSQNLSFGSLTASGTPANVTIAPPTTAATGANVGTRVASTTGVTLIGHTGAVTTPQNCNATSACGAAVLTVTGGAGMTLNTVTITPPANLTSGANTMAFSAVTVSPTGTLTLDGSGNLIVNMGGTLAVAANQAAGAYTGTISVTLDY